MQLANLGQIKALHTIKSSRQMDEDTYRSMISAASDGRTSSSKQLTYLEAQRLITSLMQGSTVSRSSNTMRRKIIAMAREIGWMIEYTNRVDMDRVNNWCLKFSFLKKKLNAYKHEELPKLVTQFENGPYKSHLIKL